MPNRKKITLNAGLMLSVLFMTTGCSTFQSSHIVEPEPALSVHAVASADADAVPQALSLVASDSIGMATFGYDLVAWDNRFTYEAVAAESR